MKVKGLGVARDFQLEIRKDYLFLCYGGIPKPKKTFIGNNKTNIQGKKHEEKILIVVTIIHVLI